MDILFTELWKFLLSLEEYVLLPFRSPFELSANFEEDIQALGVFYPYLL